MPLLLESPDGQQRFELAIVGYESPDAEVSSTIPTGS